MLTERCFFRPKGVYFPINRKKKMEKRHPEPESAFYWYVDARAVQVLRNVALKFRNWYGLFDSFINRVECVFLFH